MATLAPPAIIAGAGMPTRGIVISRAKHCSSVGRIDLRAGWRHLSQVHQIESGVGGLLFSAGHATGSDSQPRSRLNNSSGTSSAFEKIAKLKI